MALRFIDGFDHYATADLLKKWTNKSLDYNDSSIQTNGARSGTGMLLLAGYYGSWFSKLIDSQATWIVGGAFKISNLSMAYSLFTLADGTTDQVVLKYTSTGALTVSRGTTVLGTSLDGVVAIGGWYYIELKATIANSGSAEVKVSGKTVLTLSAVDTQNSGNAYANTIKISGKGDYLDDFYVCDGTGSVNNDFLGDIKIETIYPSGAGANTQWDPSTGANYDCVNETPHNSDTDYVSTAVAGEIDTYAFGNLVTTVGTVKGVQVNMVARKDDAGSRSIAPVVRPVSTDYVGTTQSILDGYMTYFQMYNLNPETSLEWTIADVNGTEFGVKLIE